MLSPGPNRFFVRHPGSYTTSAIAGNLCHGAIRIEETNRPGTVARPLQIFHSIRANSGIAGAQIYGTVTSPLCAYFCCIKNQKIIATRVGS